MNEDTDVTDDAAAPDRWTLIRDIAVLQLKLLADSLRDVALVPISLVIGLLCLLKGGPRPGAEFYDLLRFGRRTEHWINLFGAAERVYPDDEPSGFGGRDIDGMLAGVETYIVDEYRRGGITAQAKDRLDRLLDSVQRVVDRQRRDSADKDS